MCRLFQRIKQMPGTLMRTCFLHIRVVSSYKQYIFIVHKEVNQKLNNKEIKPLEKGSKV